MNESVGMAGFHAVQLPVCSQRKPFLTHMKKLNNVGISTLSA
jgi:hypothetical protein